MLYALWINKSILSEVLHPFQQLDIFSSNAFCLIKPKIELYIWTQVFFSYLISWNATDATQPRTLSDTHKSYRKENKLDVRK